MKNVYGALLASVSIISAAGALNAATLYQYTYTPGDLTTVITNPGEDGASSADLSEPTPGLSFILEFTTDGPDQTPFAGVQLVLDGDGIIVNSDRPDVFLLSLGDWFDFVGFVTFDDHQNIIAWSITNFDAESGDGCGAVGEMVEGITTGRDFCNYVDPREEIFGTAPIGWSMFSEAVEDNGGGMIDPGNPEDQGGGGGLPGPVPLPPSPVPLPASALLLLSGLGALGAGGVWRRRRAAA